MKTLNDSTVYFEHTTIFPDEMTPLELREAFRAFLKQGNYVLRKTEASGGEEYTNYSVEVLE